MAVPAADAASAAAIAEWFVTDFLTVEAEASSSFVQWAKALTVEPTPSGYRVTVLFAVLGAGADGAYVRQPVRALRVGVDRVAGGWQPDGLPQPASVPIDLPTFDVPPSPGPVPPDIAASAAAAAAGWAQAAVVGGEPTESGWRVLLEVLDEAGNRWPLQVVLPG